MNSPGRFEIQIAKLHVTNAQMLALNTTPQQVIPAPGAGKFICILGGCYYNNGSADFTDASPLGLFYGAVGNALPADLSAEAANKGPKTAGEVMAIQGAVASGSGTHGTLANMANQSVNFTSAANPTVGDGDVFVTVLYCIVSVVGPQG